MSTAAWSHVSNGQSEKFANNTHSGSKRTIGAKQWWVTLKHLKIPRGENKTAVQPKVQLTCLKSDCLMEDDESAKLHKTTFYIIGNVYINMYMREMKCGYKELLQAIM